jgi:glutathione-regulated potassium-efflux system ancillary protein KefF
VLHGARRAAGADVTAHIEVFRQRLATYPDWPELEDLVQCVGCEVPPSDRPVEIAEAS